MTGRVLIGKVKNKHQLTVNLEERFYHIPEAVMVKSMLPVEYVALYFDEADTTGEKAFPLFSHFLKKRNVHLVVQKTIHLQDITGTHCSIFSYAIFKKFH